MELQRAVSLGKESMLTTVTLTLSEYGQMNILVRWS